MKEDGHYNVKEKTYFADYLLLCATLCYACGRKDENQNDVFVDENSGNKIVGEKDVDEIPEINPRTTYAGESESQEDMELDENDANWDDDSDLNRKNK